MSVVVSMEEVGPCRQELTIEVPRPALDAETERVTEQYRKHADLPGFRKGKAPKGLVAKKFAKEIREEVVERMVPRYWRQAEAEKELDPILPPQLKEVDFELGEAMTFVAVVETRPEIELGDLEEFDLPSSVTQPTDEEVDRRITEMRRRAGTWQEVDRPAARGDLVKVTITSGEGEDEEEDELSFEVGEERVWEELSVSVQGLKAGQRSSFTKTVGEEGEEEEKEYTVEVDKVEELELAELNEEFVREISRFETVGELEEAVTERLGEELADEARKERERALLQQLRDRHPMRLPQGVVHEELESMVREYAHDMARQGVDVENADIDWGQLGEQLRPQAEKAVHTRLLLDAVADEKEIEVPEEKLEAMLADVARSRETSTVALRRELDQSGRLATLRKDLRRQEAVAELLGERTVEETESSEGPEPSDAPLESTSEMTEPVEE